MNIFSEMFYSIAGVKKYPGFLKNKGGKVFGYVLMVVLLGTMIAQALTIPRTAITVTSLKDALMEIPDFELKNGKLDMEDSFTFDADDVYVFIESENFPYIMSFSTSEWESRLEDYESVMLMDRNSILIKSDGEIDMYDYPESLQVTRSQIYGYLDYIYLIVAIYLVFVYIFSVIGYFFSALFVALVGMIIGSFMKQKLTFGQLYLLSLYAKTLPLFIKGLMKLFSIDVFGFSIITFSIACVYLGFAIHHMDMLDEEKKRVDGPIIF